MERKRCATGSGFGGRTGATGVVRTATSGANGDYALPNLPIGPYQLEVTKDGFSKYSQTGIVLQVDANPTVDVSLQVGAASAVVFAVVAAISEPWPSKLPSPNWRLIHPDAAFPSTSPTPSPTRR